jgi:tRNA G10  N-methylase Trm11
MKFFFILGRNPALSRAEVLEFLKARNRTHKEILFERNLLIIETNEGEKLNIQEFGGVIHLGEITFEGNLQEFSNYLNKVEIVPSDKFSYAVFGDADIQILKEKFKQERKKASIKHGRKLLEFQDGTKHELPKADFYIFFHKHKNITYFGTASQTYDDTGVKTRDMQKPIRRESLAISPRLSKILINLSGAKSRDLILDPFCGIGGILMEAILKNIKVYGIDKDKQSTIDAKTNIEWLKTEYLTNSKEFDSKKNHDVLGKYNVKADYRIENNDSRKAPDLQFSAIATETPLGKVLRKKSDDKEAKQIITNFEAYIIPILKRIKSVKKPQAKIAITFPVVLTNHADANKIAEKAGLKIYMNPILESRSDQFISRDILILQ